ncbi:zinc finger, CCHC-type containing protein [Tanacetum coccineum]
MVVRERGVRTNPKTKVDVIVWWIDSGAITHVCIDRCWFKTFEPVENESVLYMGDKHFAPVHGKGRFGTMDEALDKFRIYKTKVELQQNDLIKTLRTDKGGKYYDPVFFQSVGIIHETTAPHTPQQNDVAERKNRALIEMVYSMLSYSGLSEGFWGEAMLTAYYLLNKVPNKRNNISPYELWFYVIEPNDSVSINSMIESRDAIFDEKHFSSIPILKDVIPNLIVSQKDDHSDDVPREIPKPRKEEDPRTYNEAMQSRDATFGKEAIDDEIGSIMKNNTWVLSDLPPSCKPLGFRQKEGIDYFDTYAPVARITTIRLLLALTAIFNLVVHQIDVKTSFLNGDLDEEVYMKQPEGFIMPGNEHKAFKKQTCITSSTMESEFVALAAAGKEAEWLRNLIHEIPIWPKPIAPISIHCDSAATLAQAYSQIYNGKSRHLGVRHSMIMELIMNGVISIEFVRSQHNLADHLTKGLARDLVNKSVIGMGLKFI